MRYKQAAILILLLIAFSSTRSEDQVDEVIRTEKIQIGQQIDDALSENQLVAYYEIELKQIYQNQDLVVIVKGKTSFDDPEVRLAFDKTEFLKEESNSQLYACQNVGREICIIPEEDLIQKKSKNGPKDNVKVYIEVTQRSGENCHYIIEVEYEERLEYQFGKEYTIQLKQDMYKQIVLKFQNLETSELNYVFASIIPLEQGLINDKIEFSTKQDSIVINGISIWENGLGLSLRNKKYKRDSEIIFTIYSSSQQSFLFQTSSTKAKISLELQEIKKGYLFQDEVATYVIDLNQAKQKNPEDFDLILHMKPYFGQATIQVFTKERYEGKADPNWSFLAWGSEQIILKAKDRKVLSKDNIYYVKVGAKTELTYSIKAYLFDKDQLTIDFHDSVVGFNSKDEITNYLIKIFSVDVIQVRVMMFNIIGDNDIYIKRCETQSKTACKVTEQEIKNYENSENKDQNNIFLVVKVGDSKREFLTFTHKTCQDQSSCKYAIALKGTTDQENKYALRVGNDAQHVLLQNNVPYKDNVAKFDVNFYKFVSPSLGSIQQIDFIITNFVGQVIGRASTTSKYPRMHDFEKQSTDKKVITYTAADGDLSEKTFYLSIFGESDSIFTITPHIIFNKEEEFEQDPGIQIIDGIKQVLLFSKIYPTKYFYLKVPVDSENKVPKLSLNLITAQGASYYRVYLDSNYKTIHESPENARFKNSEVDTQITIQDGTLQGEMILYGMIQSLHQPKDKDEINSLSLYYHTDFVAFEFQLNQSHVHLFHKKNTQYFSFQITKSSKYYISVITTAQEQYNLDFYISLDNKITKPNTQHNTAKFKAFEGFVIDEDLIDKYCPFLNIQTKEIKQSCNVALAGYAYSDVLATITISNDGSIFQLFEGINFRTSVPLPNEFSYFFHDIVPGVEHTKIEVTSSSSHLQIYATIFVISKNTTDLIEKKYNFPTSQKSEYQSNLDLFSQQSAIIQVNSKDKQGCETNTCQVLITIDNLDTKVNENNYDNYMNVLVTNDKSVIELIEGNDYEITKKEDKFTYFKFYVGQEIKSLKFELHGANENDYEDSNQQPSYNQILVSNSTLGLPTYENSEFVEILNNMVEILPKNDQVYINSGMYYFAVKLDTIQRQVFARLTTNKNQIVNLSIDGLQRVVYLDSQEVAYAIFSLHQESDKSPFEFLILNTYTEYQITLYADSLYQRIKGIKEIEDIVLRKQIVGEMSKDTHKIQFNHEKKNYHYVAKIESKIKQKITFLLRTDNSIQQLTEGFYFKDVISPKKFRIFDLKSEKALLRLTVFSGQIQISLLNPQEKKTGNISSWIEKKEIVYQISFSKQGNNVIGIPIKKNENKTQNDLILIENINDKSNAFYFIENINFDNYKLFDPNLLPGHPRSGSLRPGDTASYTIQNLGLVKTIFKLSIFFPSLHIREQFNEQTIKPEVNLKPLKGSSEFNIIDLKMTQSQTYCEFEINQGKVQLNITRIIEDLSLENDYTDIIEYIISLDTQGIMHVIDDAKYYQTQSSKSVNVFEYFREWGTPFIVEVFDCAGDTTLALSESLKAVKEFSSDLIMRQKNFGNYKFYTFTTFDAEEQVDQDVEINPDDDINTRSSLLYIGAKPRSLDPITRKAEYILKVSSFPSDNHQAFMLPFDSFYIKNDSILVEELEDNKQGRTLRFSTQNIRCEQNCLQVRARINYVTYELYLASSLHSLQEYSVCHTNLTNYKDLSQQYFKEAESNNGFLLIRKAVKSFGLSEKSKKQAVFDVPIKDLSTKPKELFYTVVATVNLQEYGSKKSQKIPIFYKKEKLQKGWHLKCLECEYMKKEIEENQEEQKEKNQVEKAEQSSQFTFYSVTLMLFFILLGIVCLYFLYKAFVYCKNRGHYSLKNIFSNTASQQELNEYHQHHSYS